MMAAPCACRAGTGRSACVAPGMGRLVPTDDGLFSPSRFAHEVRALTRDPGLARHLGDQGPAAVATFRRSAAADTQEAVYLAAVFAMDSTPRASAPVPREPCETPRALGREQTRPRRRYPHRCGVERERALCAARSGAGIS